MFRFMIYSYDDSVVNSYCTNRSVNITKPEAGDLILIAGNLNSKVIVCSVA